MTYSIFITPNLTILESLLGEQVGELEGKVIFRRVVDVTNSPEVEVSVTRTGNLRGVKVTELVTYYSTLASDGSLHARGQGVILNIDGSESVSHSGIGIGHVTGPGKLSWRGSDFCVMQSQGKLGSVNNLIGIWKVEEHNNIGIHRKKVPQSM